ncbi:MAG TPA: hypothetical protein VN932_04245 [Rhizomicrobium sp.]|nr:hypothetical protein [Rhizomicrobium sp.]
MTYSLDFAPHVPDVVLWLLIAAAGIVFIASLVLRARGAWWRALAFAVAIFALADPLIVHEKREPLPDVVALIVDHSPSMDIRGRRGDADKAAVALRDKLAADKSLEIRAADITTPVGEDTGTQLFGAISSALADVPPDRVAGVIALTDGEVHDAPAGKPALAAPLHALIVGQRGERDRKLTVVGAARYVIVGQTADVTIRVDDFGAPPGSVATVDLRIDGVAAGSRNVIAGKDTPIKVAVAHGGENVVELAARPGPSELSVLNNRAVVTINGVRDRLRVLLVSGEPHAGERVWRSLLKADPAVDLVQFTILRPLTKQDATPIDQLSLIAFPTHELFVDKLDSFDLVILDRYSEQGILPLAYFENIARYVDNGGALLVAAGPEYAGPQSISHTPLAAVLPAQATGAVVAQGFKPMVTAQGLASPVTRDLEGANTATAPPTWGRWFRLIVTSKVSGETLMSGPGDQPLLVLDRVGKGRVAELLSDQAWLWARDFEGGGPDAELLRRLAHWLMKEPELEEERLTATIAGDQIVIERRTMADSVKPVTLTFPSGKQTVLTPTKTEPGLWRATAKADELGLYRATDGTFSAVAASGPLNPKEVADMRATDAILKAPAEATGGSVRWLADGLPSIRRISPGSVASGDDWIGLRANGAYRVTSVEQQPLLPAWLALLLILGTLLMAWRWEGR